MDYPFVKCLNPRKIVNPYTGEHLVVPCGSCPACSLRKSQQNAMKCKLESLSHKFCMFITLTYNPVSLPKMIVKAVNRQVDECGEVYDTGEQFAMIDITQRLGTQGTFLGHLDNPLILRELAQKVGQPKGILPHLSKYDLQLFIKRLRINLQRYYERRFGTEAPKIRYYAIGEYGPVHFRPHYHVLLWFSEDEIYKVIRQMLHKSWTFGRIDCQKSQGKSADYVAKYVNCSVSLPLVFKADGTRPFAVHSSHLGEEILKVSRSAVYENEFETAVTRCIPNFSTDSDVVLWRSLKSFYFPKCKGYAQKSKHERLFSYTTFKRASDWTQEDNCAAITRIIMDCILGDFYHHPSYDRIDRELIDYFRISSGCCPFDTDKNMDYYYQRIYMELRISKHFLEFVCDNNPNLITPMMQKIDDFWSWNDYQNLKRQMTDMEDYVLTEWYDSDEDYQWFYFNRGFDAEKFKQTSPYRKYCQAAKTNSENAVKHKRLNDLNKVFDNR